MIPFRWLDRDHPATITETVRTTSGKPTSEYTSISGMKFNDLNGNGAKDSGEPVCPIGTWSGTWNYLVWHPIFRSHQINTDARRSLQVRSASRPAPTRSARAGQTGLDSDHSDGSYTVHIPSAAPPTEFEEQQTWKQRSIGSIHLWSEVQRPQWKRRQRSRRARPGWLDHQARSSQPGP